MRKLNAFLGNGIRMQRNALDKRVAKYRKLCFEELLTETGMPELLVHERAMRWPSVGP